MSTLRVNNMTNVGGTGPTYAPGHVIQTVSTTLQTPLSTTSTTFTDATGLSVSITPKSSNSKIFVTANLTCAASADTWNFMQIVRDSTVLTQITPIRMNDTALTISVAGSILDSPTTTASLTYKIQWRNGLNSSAIYLNRRGFDSSAQGSSTITVMEVAA